MGRPFNQELGRLEATYRWARALDISPLRDSVKEFQQFPLVSVGSGGSLTTAVFSTLLHQDIGQLSEYSTPLDVMQSNCDMHDVALMVATARGQHSDSIACLRSAASRQLRHALVLCGSFDSPMAKLARGFGFDAFEFKSPAGRDGFLAVNSIIASNALLTRAYYEAAEISTPLPRETAFYR